MTESMSPTLAAGTGLTAARRVMYRYLSLAFLDPRAGSFTGLADPGAQQSVRAACELLRSEGSFSMPELAMGEWPIEHLHPAEMIDRLPSSEADLNSTYEQTFGLLATSPNPPYETEYIDGKLTFQCSQELADLAGFYRAFGLDASHERPDHIALELEFMAFLIGLEFQATESHEAATARKDRCAPDQDTNERAAVCRDAQARFLKEHLTWWSPAFARLLEHERPDGFYAAAGKLLAALLPCERGLLGVKPERTVGSPTPIERPEECEGCLFQL